jgi:CheY-like chemotaxis protein
MPKERLKVLVVDDDRDILLLIRIILGRDYQIATAQCGLEALDKAVAWKPHLVLTDLSFQDLTPEKLVACIRQEPALAAIPIVLMSGRGDPGQVNGASDFLMKPFSGSQLKKKLGEWLLAGPDHS